MNSPIIIDDKKFENKMKLRQNDNFGKLIANSN